MSKFKVGDRFVIKEYEMWPSSFYGHRGVIVAENRFGRFECETDIVVEGWKHGRIFNCKFNDAEKALELEAIYDSPLYQALK